MFLLPYCRRQPTGNCPKPRKMLKNGERRVEKRKRIRKLEVLKSQIKTYKTKSFRNCNIIARKSHIVHRCYRPSNKELKITIYDCCIIQCNSFRNKQWVVICFLANIFSSPVFFFPTLYTYFCFECLLVKNKFVLTKHNSKKSWLFGRKLSMSCFYITFYFRSEPIALRLILLQII